MSVDLDDLVTRIRLAVLQHTIETTVVPSAGELAAKLGLDETSVLHAYRELGERHIYVVEPNDPRRLRMANPFSGVPTAFLVSAAGRQYFGNCVWDSLGIVSVLGGHGTVVSECPDCHAPLRLHVDEGRLIEGEGVVHFSVPARHWWDDIIFT